AASGFATGIATAFANNAIYNNKQKRQENLDNSFEKQKAITKELISNNKTELASPWPPNDGALLGTKKMGTLKSGIIDRYGPSSGNYTSPAGTPLEQRSLAPWSDKDIYNRYEVIKPIRNVQQSVIAPYFGLKGMGIQFKLPYSVEYLEAKGYLRNLNIQK